MLLTEMFNDRHAEYQDLSSDKSIAKQTDLRKTRLTLAQINQLRKMNEQRTVEYMQELKQIQQQYGQPAAPPQ
jgi:hypothetical protein